MEKQNEQATVEVSLRQQVLNTTQEDFTSNHTRKELDAFAAECNVDAEALAGAKTKADVTALIYGQFAKDLSIRRVSLVDSPVAYVWTRCDEIVAEAMAKAEAGDGDYVKPRRKDLMATLKDEGVAHHTARTQIQLWNKATNGGERRLADMDDLPRSVDKVVNPTADDSGTEDSEG